MVNITEKNVFFVDDDPAVRSVVARILRESGIKVVCFDDPVACLLEMRSRRFDLLVTDLKMPGMDGIELLQKVKRLTPWIPVLVMSAYGDIPAAVRAVKAGAEDFIEKPLNKRSFVHKVKSILEASLSHGTHPTKPLTQTELRVLGLVLQGKSNKEIAEVLYRSPRTVEGHRSNLMHKLGADNLLDLLRRGIAMCSIDMSEEPELARATTILGS